MALLDRIKELCEQYSYTFASLEREAGLGQGTIRRWDKNIPSADKLLSVANLLDTTVDYLLTGKKTQIFKQTSGKFIDCSQLNDLGIKKIQEYVNDLLDNPKYIEKKNISDNMIKTIEKASAMKIVTKQK